MQLVVKNRIFIGGQTMYQNDTMDGLYWSSFFFSKNEREKTKLELLNYIKSNAIQPYESGLENLLDIHSDEFDKKACEIAVLEYCLNESGFAKDVLSTEDYEKALNQFERKQYSSKLLKKLLGDFNYLLIRVRAIEHNDGLKKIKYYLLKSINLIAENLRQEHLNKEYLPLKQKISKICSGVNSVCYFEAEKNYFARFDDGLKKFILEKYGYNIDKALNMYSKSDAYICKRALLDDEKFWTEHEKFDIFAFLNNIYNLNGYTHAQKVISHIFDNIISDEIGKKLIENNLPIMFINKREFLSQIKEHTFMITFKRFNDIYDLNKIKNEPIIYPLETDENVEKKLVIGKEITNEFFKEIYPNDSGRVFEFFNGELNKEKDFYRLDGKYTIKDMFLFHTFGYWGNGENAPEYNVAKIYSPEYFSAENMWNRIYLIAYAMVQIEKKPQKYQSNLFEIFYDLFRAIEIKFGLKTSFQRDIKSRNEAYEQLKQILKCYDIDISDKFKNDYIISLLDRKVAIMEESERFPVLEQLGDAIYNFCVAEMMFYQPADLEENSIFNSYDNFVCAEAQIKIANMLSLDKIYISSGLIMEKHTRDTLIRPNNEMFWLKEERSQIRNAEKYLADSLEMIIGVICKDCGYKKAIEFTKDVIKKAYPDVFTGEIYFDSEIPEGLEIDSDYWNRIRPCPLYQYYYNTYLSEMYSSRMWEALSKFLLTYSLGTENKTERNFITNHFARDNELFEMKYLSNKSFNITMYDYLHKGLDYIMKHYAEGIKEKYKKISN